jgi:hypothetical protein
MKLTRKELRKVISEFRLPEKMYTPNITSGNGFPPPADNPGNGGGQNKCQNFEEVHDAISYLHGELTEYFINMPVADYEHLDVYEFTDIPFDIAARNHGIQVAKELIAKCGRYNSSVMALMTNPKVLLGDDPIRSYNQNFQNMSRQGIERNELKHTILILRQAIRMV